jgi:DNA-cytosine methyltransferase
MGKGKLKNGVPCDSGTIGKGNPKNGFPRVPKVIKVGCDFGGLNTLPIAMKRMFDHSQFSYEFNGEILPASRSLSIASGHEPGVWYEDVTLRDHAGAPETHFYLFTPPCQSYSTNGKRQGIKDPRGLLVAIGIKYVMAKKPQAVMLEEVKGFLMGKNKKIAKGLTVALQKLGYSVKWGQKKSDDFGGATDRERVFMVGIRNDCLRHKFCFPKPQAKQVRLLDVLDPFNPKKDKVCRLPKGVRQKQLAIMACQDAKAKRINPQVTPIAVDIDCSVRYRTWGNNVAKTLTKARGISGGPWISTRGRRTTIDELLRIQGFLPCEVPFKKAKISKSVSGQMLGDCVPVNLLGNIMAEVFWCAGLVNKKPEFKNRMIEFVGSNDV